MLKKSKAIVLLSAGLDSTVNLFLARHKYNIILILTFDYGQRAADKEISQSQKIAHQLNIPHQIIEMPWLQVISKSSLNRENVKIPTGKDVSIDDPAVSLQTARSVWVPNRNGLFLNIAAAYAESFDADVIIPGFNLEEAQTFPDNSEDFIKSSTEAFKFSTQNHVRVECFTVRMNKTEIVRHALEQKVPLELLWPCYFNNEIWCGQCESCLRTGRAMKANGVDYEKIIYK